MKFKSYYWAIIVAGMVVILALAVPTFILKGNDQPQNPHSPEELERLRSEAVDYTPQIQAYTDLVTANPGDTLAMAGLGDVYLQQGKYSEAADWYSKAIAVQPGEPSFYGRLGEAYYGQGMVDVALRELQKGLAIDPNNQAILLDIGTVYQQTGKPEEAKNFWQKAYDINPSNQYGHVAQQLLAGPEATPEATP